MVTGYLLLMVFGRTGPVGQVLETLGLRLAFHWTGAVLAAIVMGFPLMVRAMRLAIEAVDPKLEEAAATLGAPGHAVFTAITLPLIMPGILAGAVMGFAKAMGEFGPRSPLWPIFRARPRPCPAPSGPPCRYRGVKVRRW